MANFFDKLVVGVNKGVSSVSEGSKVLVERAKLNTQLQEVEKKKSSLMGNLGLLVYNLYKSGQVTIDQCAGVYGEIDKCAEEIEGLQKAINELSQEKAVNVQAAADDPNGKVCSCGKVNKLGAKFCAGCGSPLAE